MYLDFIPGLISTILSTLETTRIVTSPAPELFLFKNSFTRFSKTSPSFVCWRPVKDHHEITMTMFSSMKK